MNKYLNIIIIDYGTWVYLILFLLIFCETELVFTSFLQRDTLILVLGALAASGDINLVVMGMARIVAAITGNVVNYFAGR